MLEDTSHGTVVGTDGSRLGLRWPEVHSMAGMAGVCPGKPSGRSLREERFFLGTALTVSDPRGYLVGVVAGVSMVVECKLLDSPVANLKVVQFVGEVPATVTLRARDCRRIIRGVDTARVSLARLLRSRVVVVRVNRGQSVPSLFNCP